MSVIHILVSFIYDSFNHEIYAYGIVMICMPLHAMALIEHIYVTTKTFYILFRVYMAFLVRMIKIDARIMAILEIKII